ncbi:hypothetical protein K2X85_10740 [bacterium]|nr:hypothetical protein [bacterium]
MPSERAEGATFVLDAIRQGFANPVDGLLGVFFLLFLAVLLGMIGFLFVVRRREESRENQDDPNALFEELAAGHGLDGKERHALNRLARVAHVERPDFLFAMPDSWKELADADKDPAARSAWQKIFTERAPASAN